MKRMLILVVAALAAVIVLAGCNKPENTQPAPPVAPEAKTTTDLTPEAGMPPSGAGTETMPPRTSPVPPRNPAVAAPTDASGKTYTVQKGDTLYSIARKMYGDPKRWKDIQSANGLPNENIKIGQVLKLP
jgi:nucleoid-associated protein YgaU